MQIANLFRSSPDGKFGAIKGVYIPDVLQMIGVILFMRLGWILGHVGMLQMGAIVCVSSGLLFLTSFSMTSIVSNMKMRGGGSYYLISRSLGIEFGSAIGVLQCLSSFCSIALCTTGFSLSLSEIFPTVPIYFFKAATLTVLFLISYASTDLALKTQVFIFAALGLAISSIFWGHKGVPTTLSPSLEATSLSFWAAFAMFFPAMTGIESGMAMSGDLKNPSRAIPIGTFAAVATVFLLYSSIALFLSSHVGLDLLRAHPFLLYSMNHYSFLILIGVWAATLSSAMGAILGGPRVMQAISKDGVLPKFLGIGYGPTNQPRNATLFVYAFAMPLTLFSEINQIIPIMTMICLVSYGLINFIAFFESFLKNPSWRPTFKTHWSISLVGCVGCFLAMLMINPGATFIVVALVVLLCFWTSSRNLSHNLDDIRHGLYTYFVHKGTAKLSRFGTGAKNWRPQILALFDKPQVQKNLAFFAHALNQEKGFLTFGASLRPQENDPTELLNRHLKEFKIPSYVHVNTFTDPASALDQMIRNYGFGQLKPNTILFSTPSDLDTEKFVRLLLDTHAQKKNILLLKDDGQMDYLYSDPLKQNKEINLWWRGKYPGNFELCLALAYLLQQSKLWPKSKIRIKMIAKDEKTYEEASEQFEKVGSRLRIKNLEFSPILDPEGDFFANLQTQKGDLTFLGLKRPAHDTALEEYHDYYLKLLEKTQGVKNIAYVLSGEDLSFRKIFL